MKNKEKGNLGEQRAAVYCQHQGYEILERQYRTRFGEIDLICHDKNCIVFIEVKSWATLDMDSLEYGITGRKKQRMFHLAEHFLLDNPQFNSFYKRFDLIFLSRRTGELEHIENAF